MILHDQKSVDALMTLLRQEEKAAVKPQEKSEAQKSLNLQEYDFLFKFIILGDDGSGKSSLLTRYTDSSFFSSTLVTLGIDFKIRNLTLNGKHVKMQIWDTAGQERYRGIVIPYYRGAHAALFVYDIANRASFDSIEKWMNEFKEYVTEDAYVVLVGNKSDKGLERTVTIEEGSKLAEEHGMKFIETSAKDDINVNETFENTAREMCDKMQAKGIYTNNPKKDVQRLMGGVEKLSMDNRHRQECSGGC